MRNIDQDGSAVNTPNSNEALTLSPNGQAALELVRAGYPVFPTVSCAEGRHLPANQRKRPLTPNGFKDASDDEAQIRKWWTRWPDANIATEPECVGLCVIDLDPGAVLTGLDLPFTYRTRTPRGGSHLWYNGSLPPSASKLALHIDTRGKDSYVLLPPSRVVNPNGTEGQYVVIDNVEPAELPASIAAKVETTYKPPPAASDIELDLAINQRRYRDHLLTCDPAISGRGGNNTTFLTAARARDYNISEEVALPLMAKHYNPRCVPPWDHETLAAIVHNAFEYGQNPEGGGSRAASSWDDFVKKAKVDPSAAGDGQGQSKSDQKSKEDIRDRYYGDEEMDGIPAQERGVDGLYMHGDVVIMYGQPKSGKSTVVHNLAWAVSSDLTHAFGTKHRIVKRGPVLIFSKEGPRGEARRRKAWRDKNNYKGPLRYKYRPSVPLARWIAAGGDQEALGIYLAEGVKLCIEQFGSPPVLVIVDTVARSMKGLDENSSKDMENFVELAEFIRDMCDCSVIAVHHSGKDKAKGGRGSTSLGGGVDVVGQFEKGKNKISRLTITDQREENATGPYHYRMERVTFDDVPHDIQEGDFDFKPGASVAMWAEANEFESEDETKPKKKSDKTVTSGECSLSFSDLYNVLTSLKANYDYCSLTRPDLAVKLTERDLGLEPKVEDFTGTMQERTAMARDAGRDWRYKRECYEEILTKGVRKSVTKENPQGTPTFAGLFDVIRDPRKPKHKKPITLFFVQADHLPPPAADPTKAPAADDADAITMH